MGSLEILTSVDGQVMLNLHIVKKKDRNLKILCLGAHGDDIEIGCGGAILKILSEHEGIDVHWIVLGSNKERRREALASANKFLKQARRREVTVRGFKDSFFPSQSASIKKYFETIKATVSPDIVFSHYRGDLHQDHSLVSQLTWNTFRDHLILEYEIIKYDGDLGSPNLFFQLDETICQAKVTYIMDSFKSQRKRDWFTADSIFSIMRIRGLESRSPGKYAEGFYCRKGVVQLLGFDPRDKVIPARSPLDAHHAIRVGPTRPTTRASRSRDD